MKFCAKCLHQINSSAKFCYHCGEQIQEEQVNTPDIRQKPGAREITEKNSHGNSGGSRILLEHNQPVQEIMDYLEADQKENQVPSRLHSESKVETVLKNYVSTPTEPPISTPSAMLQQELNRLDVLKEDAISKNQISTPQDEKTTLPPEYVELLEEMLQAKQAKQQELSQENATRQETTQSESTGIRPEFLDFMETSRIPKLDGTERMYGTDDGLLQNKGLPLLSKEQNSQNPSQNTNYPQNQNYQQNTNYTQNQNNLQNQNYRQNSNYTQNQNYQQNSNYTQNQNYQPNTNYTQNQNNLPSQNYQQHANYAQNSNYPQNGHYQQNTTPHTNYQDNTTQNFQSNTHLQHSTSQIRPELADFMNTARIPNMNEFSNSVGQKMPQNSVLQQQMEDMMLQLSQRSQPMPQDRTGSLQSGQVRPEFLEFMNTSRIPTITDHTMTQGMPDPMEQLQQMLTNRSPEPREVRPEFMDFMETTRIPKVTDSMVQQMVHPQTQEVALAQLQELIDKLPPMGTQAPPEDVRPEFHEFMETTRIPKVTEQMLTKQREISIPIQQNNDYTEEILRAMDQGQFSDVMEVLALGLESKKKEETPPPPKILQKKEKENKPSTPMVEVIPPKNESKPYSISEQMERGQILDCLKLCYEAILALGVAQEELIKAKLQVKKYSNTVKTWEEKIDTQEEITMMQKIMFSVGFWALFGFAFWFLGLLAFLLLKMTPLLTDVPISEFSIWTHICLILSSISVFALMRRRNNIHEDNLDELANAQRLELSASNMVDSCYRTIFEIAQEENTKFMLDFLSPPYASLDAVISFITYLENGRADTLKEAMNIYESEKQSQKLQELQQINLETVGAIPRLDDEEEVDDRDEFHKKKQTKMDTARRQARLNQNSQKISKQVRYANAITVIDSATMRK